MILACKFSFCFQDRQGNSALHYATMFWPEDIVSRLLKLGANVGLTNLQGEPPILNILPSTMENFLDTVALSSNKRNPSNENFAINFDYSFLAPLHTKPFNVTGGGKDHVECCPLLPCSNASQPGNGKQFEPKIETEVGRFSR